MATQDWQNLSRLTAGASFDIERVRLTGQDVAIEGRFEKRNDRDHYQFGAKKGTKLSFVGQTRSLGSPSDLFMRIYNAEGGVVAEESGTWSLTPKVRAIPQRLRSVWWVRHLNLVAAATGLLVAIVLPLVFDSASHVFLLARVLLYAMVALSVTVLTGWGGQLSLGQFAFVGLGAMTAAALAERDRATYGSWTFERLADALPAGARPYKSNADDGTEGVMVVSAARLAGALAVDDA